MTYKLFIDDERLPVTNDWVIVKTSFEAKETVTEFGIPAFISFDHDLGNDDTTMIFLHWFIDRLIHYGYRDFPEFDVHSQNPVGAENIRKHIESYKNFIKKI